MKRILALTLALLMLLAGCSEPAETTAPSTETTAPVTQPETQETTEPVTEPATVPTTLPVETEPPETHPLTGQELSEPMDNRIFAVMINNQKEALPQAGIGQADIVYEILAEGSTTRLMALFSDPAAVQTIGPVRSLRAYFLNIMRGYNAVCTSAGGSEEADNMVYSLGYNRVNGIAGTGAGYFYRDDWRRENRGFEHSLMISGPRLVAAAEAMDFPTEVQPGTGYGLSFSAEPMTAGEAAGTIVVHFRSGGKTTTLTYSAESGCYTAYQHGQDLIDANTDKALEFENVLVLFAHSYVMDSQAHLSVQTTGEGQGWFARDGRVIPIRWTRDKETSVYQYFDLEGNPVSFGVGRSYIAVVPEESPVDFS